MSSRQAMPHPGPTLYVNRTLADHAFLVASVPDGASPAQAAADVYAQIGDTLRKEKLGIVQERIFGSLGVEGVVKSARCEALQSRGLIADGAVNYIEGRPLWGEGLAGVIVHAVPAGGDGQQVSTILDEGVPCGRTWQNDDATFIVLQNLQGISKKSGDDNSPAEQSRRAMERAERILREYGASYRHTVRTWFYLSNILDWYGDFNRVRNAKYAEFGLMPEAGEQHLLPASTGIRADVPGGAACSLDLLAAVTDKARESAVRRLSNPCQQEAFRYGSAFSRSAVVRGSSGTLIEISGTAAIDENGRSLHPGDTPTQVSCTLDKVASLLGRAQASLDDICAATIFVKNEEDAESARRAIAERGLDRLPVVWVVADVCRDDLLFEIDAEAVITRTGTESQ